MLCVAVGLGCFVGGLAGGGGDPNAVFSAGTAAAATIQAVGSGILGSVTHSGLRDGYGHVSRRLRALRADIQPPQNHDLARNLRLAQTNALKFLVEDYRRRVRAFGGEYDGGAVEGLVDDIQSFIRAAQREAEASDFQFGGATDTEVAAITSHMDACFDRDAAPDAMNWLWREGADAVFAELTATLPERSSSLLPAFREWSDDRHGPGALTLIAEQFFADALKHDEKLRVVVFQGRFDRLDRHLLAALTAVRGLDARVLGLEETLASRFDLLDSKIAEIGRDLSSNRTRAAVTAALASPEFEALLERLFVGLRSHDIWRGSLAADSLQERIGELTRDGDAADGFFGREEEMSQLDAAIDSRESGVVVLCGPSGAGKSTLISRWAARRQAIEGDTLVQHFAWIKQSVTTSPEDCLQHLLVQIRALDTLEDPARPVASIPSQHDELLNALHDRLKRPAAEGRRLIIVIDGIDELDKDFNHAFVRRGVGRGNFLVLTHRALAGEWPLRLQKWKQLDPVRLDVAGMREKDVSAWLDAAMGQLPAQRGRRLLRRLLKVSDGVAVLVKQILLTLMDVYGAEGSADQRAAAIESLPATFSGFLQKYLRGEMDALPMGEQETALMGVVAQIRQGISSAELTGVLRAYPNPSVPDYALADGRLSQRWMRWLSARPDDNDPLGDPLYSFSHPRLAAEFALALGPRVAAPAREALLAWCAQAWRPATFRYSGETRRGALYALRHWPGHLMEAGQFEQAAQTLSDDAFVEERFLSFGASDAATMMDNDWSLWMECHSKQ